jgi:hypothetical protein
MLRLKTTNSNQTKKMMHGMAGGRCKGIAWEAEQLPKAHRVDPGDLVMSQETD